MAAKNLQTKEHGFKVSLYDGKEWIRINDILNTTDWSRSTIERKIIDGILKTKKIGHKVYISLESYKEWCNSNG
jgi:hypothetical protein